MLQFLCVQMCVYGWGVVPQGVLGDRLEWGTTWGVEGMRYAPSVPLVTRVYAPLVWNHAVDAICSWWPCDNRRGHGTHNPPCIPLRYMNWYQISGFYFL